MNRTLTGLVSLSLVAAASASAAPTTPPAHAAKACSTDGLSFTRENIQGVKFGVAVKKLRANGATCAKASKIATVAAKHVLGQAEIPATIKGFSVMVEKPCTGCTPVTKVTASKGYGASVTFNILGGA